MVDDCFVIYERKATKKGLVQHVIGYSMSGTIAASELKRLYHMNPFENRFFMEIAQYKPVDAHCFDS